MPDTDALVVLTTLGSSDAARAFVRALVERRLVACGTVLGAAQSTYRWDGAIEEATEVPVLLKTTRERLAALEAAFAELHPYDVPELLALPVAAGAPTYLDWLARETAIAVS